MAACALVSSIRIRGISHEALSSFVAFSASQLDKSRGSPLSACIDAQRDGRPALTHRDRAVLEAADQANDRPKQREIHERCEHDGGWIVGQRLRIARGVQ